MFTIHHWRGSWVFIFNSHFLFVVLEFFIFSIFIFYLLIILWNFSLKGILIFLLIFLSFMKWMPFQHYNYLLQSDVLPCPWSLFTLQKSMKSWLALSFLSSFNSQLSNAWIDLDNIAFLRWDRSCECVPKKKEMDRLMIHLLLIRVGPSFMWLTQRSWKDETGATRR